MHRREFSFERLGAFSNDLELKFCKLLLRSLADQISLADARILPGTFAAASSSVSPILLSD